MKKIYSSLFTCLLGCAMQAQLFNGTGGAILNNGGQETIFSLPVSGLPQTLDSLYGLEEICVQISHPAVEELHLYLESPAGTVVELSGVLSCSGSNFDSTCFNNNAPGSITIGNAPYKGSFRSVGNLGRFNAQKTGNGNWKLYVKDFVAGPNAGTLLIWSLKFSSMPARPVVVSSSNLPLVFIDTHNQHIGDVDVLADLSIVDNGTGRNYVTDAHNIYDGQAQIHKRGSSSNMFEKKNLKVELTDVTGTTQRDVSLLGMPAESDWVLCPGYSDKTFMRNALTQHIFGQMGYYAPALPVCRSFYERRIFRRVHAHGKSKARELACKHRQVIFYRKFMAVCKRRIHYTGESHR